MPAADQARRPASAVPARISPTAALAIALGVLGVCWLLLMPPGSGPDEQSHLTRAGAIVRGDTAADGVAELPGRFRMPEPGCYAFQPAVPVSCAAAPEPVDGDVTIATRAGDYPLWGHAWYGAFGTLPGFDPVWWARLGGAGASVALLAWALARASAASTAMAAGLLIGVTPMAWSTFGTVNPSAFAIAGAVALWVGLLTSDVPARHRWDARWLTTIGWAVLVLPRRDGMVWAVLTLVLALAVAGRSAPDWWRGLNRAQQGVIAGTGVAMLVWGALSESRSTQMIVLTPLALVAAEGWRWWWRRPVHTPATRATSVAVAAVLAAFAAVVAVQIGPGGWDADLVVAVAMQTDENLIEAVGVLGWLDTVIPRFAVYLWILAIGALATTAVLTGARRAVGWAGAIALTTAATSWLLELLQADTTGLYWQGRYSLPLLVGVPLVLTRPLSNRAAGHVPTGDIVRAVAVAGLVVLNVGAWATARRFGVGTEGSLLPWRWDTPIQPVPPLVLLLAHAAASVWLLRIVVDGPTDAEPTAG